MWLIVLLNSSELLTSLFFSWSNSALATL